MFKYFMALMNIINFFTIVYMVFKERRTANSIIAWTFILYLFPLIGFIAFLLVGRTINNRNMYRIKENEISLFNNYSKQVKERAALITTDINFKNLDMILALESLDYSPYRNDNKVELFSDGKKLFDNMIEALKNAKHSINIQFYIFKSDELGTKILDVLEERAAAGIEVRLLYDSVGSRGLCAKRIKELRAAGGKTGEFFPSWIKIINLKMNFRNHRKIVVIDNEIAYVGGFNVGDEYEGKNKKFGYWRDTHIKFTGSAVRDLELRFLIDWKYATKEDVDLLPLIEYSNSSAETATGEGIQIVSSGPNLSDKYEIKLGYLKMIQKAKRYIYIQSPYLIIDNTISDSLKLAAASGVDVRIMIPGKGDHPFVYWANLDYAGDLLECGIRIYHYDKDAFLHAKTVVIDDEVCSVGTANMDTRSFELNFEVNAFIYSEKIAKEQRHEFEKDILNSKKMTIEEYEARGIWVKAKESISRLLSAVL